ncbi:hypothetical protein TNCV_2842231 [Trichonephila clavipes]|nr:hypothetical protein TNCV_2842231 [Trichonephila clavipes]
MSVYHLHRVQLLNLKIPHSEKFLQQSAKDNVFAEYELFTDEAYFTCEEAFNQHSAHMWALENFHRTQSRSPQQHLSVNVWAGILENCVIGPCRNEEVSGVVWII